MEDGLRVERGLTLSRLTANSSRKIIENIISDQLKSIDAEIVTAHTSGFNQISHELPSNFGVNNLAKADAQIMIYSEILIKMTTSEEEGGKGFSNTTIELSANDAAILHVKWMNGMDAEERANRRQIIQQHQCITSVAPKRKNK